MMVPRGSGLIVNVSSPGGLGWFNDPVYGCGKSAVDRMASDIAYELHPHNISAVSLWPGPVATEVVKDVTGMPDAAVTSGKVESVEYRYHQAFSRFVLSSCLSSLCFRISSGVCVVALLHDHDGAMLVSGQVLQTGEIANHYDLVDPASGKVSISMMFISRLHFSLTFFICFGSESPAGATLLSLIKLSAVFGIWHMLRYPQANHARNAALQNYEKEEKEKSAAARCECSPSQCGCLLFLCKLHFVYQSRVARMCHWPWELRLCVLCADRGISHMCVC